MTKLQGSINEKVLNSIFLGGFLLEISEILSLRIVSLHVHKLFYNCCAFFYYTHLPLDWFCILMLIKNHQSVLIAVKTESSILL